MNTNPAINSEISQNSSQNESRAVRRARLASMGTAYALGTFNDSFFKQAALMLAAAAGLVGVQGAATLLFALPFVLFSAWTGWLADRLPKKGIIVWAKVLEIASMLLAIWSMYTLSWYGIILVVFLMGLQSTFFSPAINGSIPENFDTEDVPRVNAALKLATTLTILFGIALAGPVLDMPLPHWLKTMLPQHFTSQDYAFGRLCVGSLAFLVGLLGLIAALRIKGRAQYIRSTAPFPFLGPLHSAKHALDCKREDLPLFLALSGEAFFYFFSSFALLCITNLGKAQLGFSMTVTSLLSVALMFGVCIGAIISGRWPVQRWHRHCFASGFAMGLGLGLAGFCPLFPAWLQLPGLFALLVVTGIGGGLFLIPVVSCIQVRPAAHEKGKTLGISNFASFVGIMLSGPLFSFLLKPVIGTTWNGAILFRMEFAFLRGLTPSMLMIGAGLFGIAFMLLLRHGITKSADQINNPNESALNGPNQVDSSLTESIPDKQNLTAPTMADLKPGFAGCLLRLLLALRYRVTANGPEQIAAPTAKTGPILFLPNHPALVDPLIVYSQLAGAKPCPLADEGRLAGFWGRLIRLFIKVVTIPDLSNVSRKRSGNSKQEVEAGLEQVIQALRSGNSVLLYPAGRIYRSEREVIGGNSGVARILDEIPGLRVVLVRSSGLWGSSFSFAGAGGNPGFGKTLLRGLITLLGNLFLLTPRRQVQLELSEATKLPGWRNLFTADGKVTRKALNAWLEEYYNQTSSPAFGVPRFFWQGKAPYPIDYVPHQITAASDPTKKHNSSSENRLSSGSSTANIKLEVREKVFALLREAAQLPADASIDETMRLGADLDLDSLAMMEVTVGLEEELQVSIEAPENLITIGDCLLAVSGLLAEAEAESKPIHPAWFAKSKSDALNLDVLGGKIPDAFLALARKAPGEAITAERRGVRSRRDLLTAALILARRMEKLPGKRIGIMLPAAPAALGVWLAAMLAGKESVLLNWTVGESNLRHCLKLAETDYVFTSGLLLDRLARQGLPVASLPVNWLPLEDLSASLSLREKLSGALCARLLTSGWLSPFCKLTRHKMAEIAAILFTSGSEARPKAVPLSHSNLLSNARDVIQTLGIGPEEKILAMLPPFHSFGLLADMVLPLAFGLRAAFHPNPTEAMKLADLIRDFQVTLLPGTPTFLEAILERSRGTAKLAGLHYAFAGAEKCPAHVYRAFAEQCPQAALCEGYGITECSPVVSVNRPGAVLEGSIGHPMPSLEVALVLEEDGKITGVAAPGQTGMLLVRGPSIFSGYLTKSDSETPASPFVEYQDKQWYRTGDLIRQAADGRLTFQGRLKRFVKIGGEMISLPQIETILLAAFGARYDTQQSQQQVTQQDTQQMAQQAAPYQAQHVAYHNVQQGVQPDTRQGAQQNAQQDAQGDILKRTQQNTQQEGPLLAVEAAPETADGRSGEITLFTTLPLSLVEVNAVLRKNGLSALHLVKRIVKVPAIPLLGSGKTDYRSLKEKLI